MKIEKINQWFARLGEWIVKYRWGVLAGFALLVTIGFVGLKQLNITSSWEDYFLEDDPVLTKSAEFKEVFGNDNFAAVLTECENTFTKENLELIRRLSNEMMDSLTYADKITSLTDIEFMTGYEDGMTIEQIVPEEIPADATGLAEIRRKAMLKPDIASRLVSKDGRLAWILLKLRPFPPIPDKPAKGNLGPDLLTGEELHRIISKPEYARLNPKGSGMPYLSERKIKWVGEEMPRVMGLAALLAIAVLILVTRSLRGVVVPIFTAIASIVTAYGGLGFLGFKIDSGMMMIPMLLAFAVAVAYNIHVISYFKRRFATHGNRRQAVVETVGEMGWPVLFSALTTFAALLSFLIIPMRPFHFVGLATSGSVMLTFLIVIMVMPSILSFGKNATPKAKPDEEEAKGRIDRALMLLGDWVMRHGKVIIIASVVTMGFLIYQFTKIETAFDVERTMGRKVKYVNNLLSVAQSELGSMYSYDILIELPSEGDAKMPEALKRLDKLAAHVSAYPLTKRVSSAVDIVKDINQTINNGKEEHYRVPDTPEEVAQLLLLYENAGGSEAEYWMDYEYRRLRLMVEVDHYNSGEGERELADAAAYAQTLYPEAKATVVGNLPQFTSMMQYVVRGQITSFLIALVIIGILMMMVFGSVRIGLIGLIPNLTPAIVVGGLMGWMGYPLDMMTATIMPMILGLAVDDTIHFFNHGHLEFNRRGNYSVAIRRTFGIVGKPLVLTSLIICTNFLMYMTSTSLSFIHMGMLSVAGMLSALLADLCITPILFKWFRIFGKETEVAGKIKENDNINNE